MSTLPTASPSFPHPTQDQTKNEANKQQTKTTKATGKKAPKFKMIIIGAGPTGLLLAHVLSRLRLQLQAEAEGTGAGTEVDFVILERRNREEIARPQHGAALVIWPNTMRVMGQLGLLDGLREIGVEIGELRICDAWGREFHSAKLEDWTFSAHGANPMFFHRPNFVRFLYDRLPQDAREKIFTGKTVVDIQTIPAHEGGGRGGVVVSCSDGTTERGDIVIGADGVHSKVREVIMQRRIAEMNQNPTTESGGRAGHVKHEKHPYVAEFRCLFGYTGHLVPGLRAKTIYAMHRSGCSSQVFTFTDKAGFMVYQKMKHSSTSNESVSENAQGCDGDMPTQGSQMGKRTGRHTTSDVEDFLREMGDLTVASFKTEKGGTGSVRVNDLYKASRWTVLSDLHEGIVEHWHAGGTGRMVLVGDAVSKQTPHMGTGWNCGVQDVVVLSNLITSLVRSKASCQDQDAGGRMEIVTAEELDVLFQEYQRTRYPSSKICLETSMNYARSHAWDSWWYWFLDRCVQRTVNDFMWATKVQPMVFGQGLQIHLGHVLDFLPERNQFKGVIPWAHVSPADGEQD